MKVLIKNGRVVDPANQLDGSYDLLLDKGKIHSVQPTGIIPENYRENTKVIDASECVVAPGFIDMHVHFREPGFEYKETIETGCQSAAAGGFSTVAVMPNTNPIIDNRSVTEMVLSSAKTNGIINVLVIGAITKGLQGESLTEMGDLKNAGVVGFSDDGHPVSSNELMRRAFEYSKVFGLPLIQHSEILDLTRGGSMNEGLVSTELGLKGMPSEAEDIMVYRDISLLERNGGKLHVAHISSANAVELVAMAKDKGLPVTCEVAPHHFTLTDEYVRGYDTNTKMSPPLRSQRDVQAMKKALRENIIDIIATDHAPHGEMDKKVEYSQACFGVIGLETALPLTLRLVDEGVMSLKQAISKLTSRPAEIFNLDCGTLSPGKPGDVVIFNPNKEYVIDASQLKSRSKNTPFDGWKVRGSVKHTLVSGKIVYSADQK